MTRNTAVPASAPGDRCHIPQKSLKSSHRASGTGCQNRLRGEMGDGSDADGEPWRLLLYMEHGDVSAVTRPACIESPRARNNKYNDEIQIRQPHGRHGPGALLIACVRSDERIARACQICLCQAAEDSSPVLDSCARCAAVSLAHSVQRHPSAAPLATRTARAAAACAGRGLLRRRVRVPQASTGMSHPASPLSVWGVYSYAA